MTYMTRKLSVPLLLLLALPILAFPQAQVENSDQFLGELLEGKYRNGFFGFVLSPEPEMYILSDQERAIYKEAGVEMIGKDIKKGRAAFEKAASQEVLIFSVSLSKPGSTGVSSLNVGAIKQPTGTTPSEVCDLTAQAFLQNPMFTLASKTKPLKRAAKDFAQLELGVKSGERTLSVRYYVTIRKGYSLTFVITYLSKPDLDSLEKVLDSLEFS